MLTLILAVSLVILSVISLFVGVIDIELSSLLTGNSEQWEIFIISRLPRLLAILCTGVGMSVAGLIMQQLCMNKFVSPTTGATISSAQFGILLALPLSHRFRKGYRYNLGPFRKMAKSQIKIT
ncbi:MAG TPA: iron chelate uptake ABC transporter family permease subunit [Candidatus Scybalocola faecigallinarum]|uniref:Iron chelate uptake ABC transporter family permease subunit n=1 Tax=Candidatus Scybalocola faecigallinarum TaxID=2840941 RepID=A0A9D1JQ04_9FIRM|nr:iron chelate uptake ABC transporter family permease subunit [Candidatus Scybalocola faecigallinarum]